MIRCVCYIIPQKSGNRNRKPAYNGLIVEGKFSNRKLPKFTPGFLLSPASRSFPQGRVELPLQGWPRPQIVKGHSVDDGGKQWEYGVVAFETPREVPDAFGTCNFPALSA